MLDFCAKHSIGASVKTRPMAEVNQALQDLENLKGAMRYVLTQEPPPIDCTPAEGDAIA